MTQHINRIAEATTVIAAVLAFSSSTPLLAQEAPPPEVDTSVETPAPADPLAPEPSSADQAVPPAPQPKVETTSTTTTRTERTTQSATRSPARSTARSTPRRTDAAATAPAPAAETAAPAPLPAEPQPLAAAPPAPPVPVAEPAPASADTSLSDLTSPDTLPIVGAAALGLLALGGAAMVARRRKRRREDEEFEARQQALAAIEDDRTLELGSADEIQPAPAFVRAPMHDPVPATGVRTKIPAHDNRDSGRESDFMFRRAGQDAKTTVEQD